MKIAIRDLYPIAIISIFVLLSSTFISANNSRINNNIQKRVHSFRADDRTLGFFCADNGEFSGMGELHYISKALQRPVQHTIAECGNVTSGYIVSHGNSNIKNNNKKLDHDASSSSEIPALIVTTGISALNAAMCTAAIQQQFQLQKILYIGTSGWSQFVGGLDPVSGGCESLPQVATSRARGGNALGSVCITRAAASYACGLCVHNDSIAHTSECSRPSCNSRDSESLFGPCTFHGPSGSLQESILSIAKGLSYPAMPTRLQQLSDQYWKAQIASTKGAATPVVPSIHQDCLEMDMQKITASGPVDYLCREYVADILNKNKLGSAPSLTANDVNCVGAMEGTGFLRAVYGRNPSSSPMHTNVEIAIIRGASNWDSYPLMQTKWSVSETESEKLKEGGRGLPATKWTQNYNYTSESEHGEMTTLGYQYAILTTNTIALEYVNSL